MGDMGAEFFAWRKCTWGFSKGRRRVGRFGCVLRGVWGLGRVRRLCSWIRRMILLVGLVLCLIRRLDIWNLVNLNHSLYNIAITVQRNRYNRILLIIIKLPLDQKANFVMWNLLRNLYPTLIVIDLYLLSLLFIHSNRGRDFKQLIWLFCIELKYFVGPRH